MINSTHMNFRLTDKQTAPVVPLVRRGRSSPLSGILSQLLDMKDHQRIIVRTTPAEQRIVARRLRSNIFKWKCRRGLRHVSVHLMQDGNVQLSYE
jgi:hypothetical protein